MGGGRMVAPWRALFWVFQFAFWFWVNRSCIVWLCDSIWSTHLHSASKVFTQSGEKSFHSWKFSNLLFFIISCKGLVMGLVTQLPSHSGSGAVPLLHAHSFPTFVAWWLTNTAKMEKPSLQMHVHTPCARFFCLEEKASCFHKWQQQQIFWFCTYTLITCKFCLVCDQ